MSPQFNFQENELEEADVITLWDEQGRSLDCYIENAYETDDLTYMLLVPVDTPVMILAWDEESEEEESDAFLIEDSEEIERVFADAKAVLATGFSTSSAGASSVFFFAVFLGRVEESIADKSILWITFGASISGATVFSTAGAFTSGAGGADATTSATGSSLRTFLSSFLAKERSSSSLFFK